MEDVLELYQEPYDSEAPVVCMDESSKQLVGETRVPIPAAPGRPARVDYEYERKGTASIFLFTEPLQGWRWTQVAEHRAASSGPWRSANSSRSTTPTLLWFDW